ncbi:MAG: glycosyltransferase [Microthrixaceae bacterium]|nr:glycosyltransferase [Microthrixaceae bacterium]
MEQLLLAQVRGGDTDRFSYSVAYVNSDKDSLVGDFETLGIPVHCLSSGSRPWPLAVRSLLARERFDIVHVHSPLVASVVRVASATMRDRPLLVYTEHNSWAPYGIPTRWANRLTYRLDDAQFAVSRAAWESVPARLRSRLEVLSHGIDVEAVGRNRGHRDESRRFMEVSADEVVIGTVANFRPEKNYDGLLRVAARVLETNDGVRFVSIGQGPLQTEIERLHESMGLGDGFLILGAQPDAPRLMAAFDVFVLASHVEGLPVAFMEARALGLPRGGHRSRWAHRPRGGRHRRHPRTTRLRRPARRRSGARRGLTGASQAVGGRVGRPSRRRRCRPRCRSGRTALPGSPRRPLMCGIAGVLDPGATGRAEQARELVEADGAAHGPSGPRRFRYLGR